jgi:HEAT repeat protein
LPEPRKAVSIDDAVALLASQDLREWRHAQRVLFRHGPPAVPALLRATREQNRQVGEGANHVLNMLAGEEYAKALLAALDDPVLAEHARTYLQRLKTDGEASLVAAAALQAARPYRQRQTLMYIIAELPFPSTKEALLRLTRDDNPRVRSHAFYVLWSVPGDDVTQRLIEGVADPDPRAVQDAIDSLGKRKARAALPLLCELVGRPRKDEVTHFAMEALARMGDLRAAPVLIAQLRAPPEAFERPGSAPEFRTAVARALKQLTGQDLGEDADAWSRWLQEKAKETAP